jgi:GT2 family glycosyltransferase
MINVAVLITCHNRKQKTIKCLQALFKQKNIKNIKIKVFLVDDGSVDGTKQAVKKLFKNVTIIQGNGNLFWAKGMYLAWDRCLKLNKKFDYYLWLNDDTFVYNTALRIMFKALKTNTEIVTGSICDPITKRRSYGGSRLINKFLFPFKHEPIDINGQTQEIDIFNGNLVLIPHAVYIKIGSIADYFEHAFADFEYSLRAKKNNVIILLTSEHVGECERNPLNNINSDHNLFKKILSIFGRKRQPIKSWFRLCYKYGGILWPLHFFVGYTKTIIKIIF